MSSSKKDTFCILPWIHLYTNTDGTVGPCCISDYTKFRDKALSISGRRETDPSVLEALNSKAMKQLRVDMMNGIENPVCRICYHQEKLSADSQRLEKNNSYHLNKDNKKQSLLKNTDKRNGKLKSLQIEYLDIRFSNLCNFKCRDCNHYFSSSWWDEAKKLNESRNSSLYDFKKYNKDTLPKVIDADEYGGLMEKIDPILKSKNLKFIYFAGGEPLITENHYKVLERLIELKKKPSLWYNTNFSTLSYKKYNLIKMWKKLLIKPPWTNISLSISLDGMEKRGELLRSGMKWSKILENREIIRNECSQIEINVQFVWQNSNYLHSIDFFKFLLKSKFVEYPNNIKIHYLHDPDFMSLKTLLPEDKSKLEEKLSKFKKEIQSKFSEDQCHEFVSNLDSCIRLMNDSDNSHLLPLYFKNMERLDIMRNENLLETFPEFLKIKERLNV
jgi:hypothetical protein